ncbi:MAG: AraC family transcriptional regulator [Ruminococcaceae bacterium]|nr:AraC family transcriptional regulator [Oscillospiraceae bacterium]
MRIYDGSEDKKALPTKHTVAVVSSNRFVCGDSDSMTIRKKGRVDWSLFYCETGCIYFEKECLRAGQVWIYAPGVPHNYTIYGRDDTIYHYLHFMGSDMEKLLASLGIRCSCVIEVSGGMLSEIFANIQNSLNEEGAIGELQAEYHTLYLLSRIARYRKGSSKIQLMKRVTDNMEHSFTLEYDARRYADILQVSISRFNHLFSEYVGRSPYAYYTGLRIANACSLLEDTGLKIKDIAERCGYKDPLYFAQVFKKETGKTPSAYRKINKRIRE